MEKTLYAKFDRYIALKKFWWLWALLFIALVGLLAWSFIDGPFSGKLAYDVPKYLGECEKCNASLEPWFERDVARVVGEAGYCCDVDVYAAYKCPSSDHYRLEQGERVYVTTEQKFEHEYNVLGANRQYSLADECVRCGFARAADEAWKDTEK